MAPDPGERGEAGYRLHAVSLGVDGPGTPIILVHGMVVAGRGTLPLARALAAAGRPVHVPDLAGFGRSDKPRRALDVEGLARSLGRWATAAGLGGAVVVGNSFGTQVAAALAAGAGPTTPAGTQAPAALVLVSPTIDPRFPRGWTGFLPRGRPGGPPSRGPWGAAQAAWRDALIPPEPPSDPPSDPPSLRRLLLTEYLAAGPARALSTYRHALRDDLAARLPGLELPMLVVRAGEDRLVSEGWARSVAAAARHGTYRALPGADHDAQFDAPAPLAGAVGRFLSDLGL